MWIQRNIVSDLIAIENQWSIILINFGVAWGYTRLINFKGIALKSQEELVVIMNNALPLMK